MRKGVLKGFHLLVKGTLANVRLRQYQKGHRATAGRRAKGETPF